MPERKKGKSVWKAVRSTVVNFGVIKTCYTRVGLIKLLFPVRLPISVYAKLLKVGWGVAFIWFELIGYKYRVMITYIIVTSG